MKKIVNKIMVMFKQTFCSVWKISYVMLLLFFFIIIHACIMNNTHWALRAGCCISFAHTLKVQHDNCT